LDFLIRRTALGIQIDHAQLHVLVFQGRLERRQNSIIPFVPLVVGIDVDDLAGGLGSPRVAGGPPDAEGNHPD
jgi:hypothetical protein